jgi:hypothetical protein
MDVIEIKHRFSGAVLWSGEEPSLRGAVIAAVKAGADLAGAYLAGAYLAGADLAGADLAGAYLAGANLAGADLAGANLTGADLTDAYLAGANLTGADLTDAYLAGANLAGADLAGADLAGADLAGANLAGANLTGADLTDAYLAGADLAGARNVTAQQQAPCGLTRRGSRMDHARRYRERHPEVPVVENLDSKILERIGDGSLILKMADWHTCETTHCRAGSAIHLAGRPGYELEAKVGAERAGRMIYRASTGRSPYFFASDEAALADIRRCAAEEQAEGDVAS